MGTIIMYNFNKKQETPIFVCDMDETLIKTDYKTDKEKYFMELSHKEPIQPMMDIFNMAKEKMDTIILTARHPKLQNEIIQKFDCDTICRDYCIDMEEIKRSVHSKSLSREFLQDMVEHKTRIVNEFAETRSHVLFCDDRMDIFDHMEFEDNVIPLKPIHLWENSMTMEERKIHFFKPLQMDDTYAY
jgi:hydroxymethylpyrimidine pyrophosphatase-like HAD family hydrolase